MPVDDRRPARHELLEVDAAALETARAVDRLLAGAREAGAERWVRYLAPLPDRLRDDTLPELRRTARVVRSAYGPKDSVRDDLSPELTEPVLALIDRLLKAIARYETHRG